MTIDEAIKDLLYDAQCNRADLDIEWAERNEQIAEWLEELKAYRTLDKTNFSDGYNKALDDFVRFASDMPTVEEEDGEIRPMRLEEMAEQLKAGEIE